MISSPSITKIACFTGCIGAGIFFSAGLSVEAQVVPESSSSSLSTSVRIDASSGNTVIEEGVQRGNNLFHSFESFSVSPEQSVLFLSPGSVERIFGRVTGGEISVINGGLSVQDTADLFLINPAGILFGPNAVIQINGSLVASSARKINFADGLEFTTESEPDLLSVSVPTGLYFSGGSPIAIENTGHTLSSGSVVFPLQESAPTVGISSPGATIALLGGDVAFNGAIVRSPGGNITVGAVQEGYVSILRAPNGWDFSFDNVERFGSITLDHFSLLDASGPSGGTINLIGRDVHLLDSSVVLIADLFEGPSASRIKISGQSLLADGEISEVDPTLDLERRPTAPIAFVPSSIVLDNFSSGRTGSIEISGQTVALENGGAIYARSFSAGAPGNIAITARQLFIDGFNSQNEISSGIGIANMGSSRFDNRTAGVIAVNSDVVALTDGGAISSSTLNQGNGGRIEVNSERILVSSVTERSKVPSQIGALSLQGGISPLVGDGGAVDINTGSLVVTDGGAIGTSTDNSGNAGDVSIYARDFVEVDGNTTYSSIGPSRIGSDAIEISQDVRDLFGLSGIPSGQGGSVLISTPRLVVRNNGLVAVQNEGTGDAGNLNIRSQSIQLANGGQLSASTLRGNGGNIILDSGTLLAIGGLISTTAQETGDGGNVIINSDVIALLAGSSITANAAQGAGGRVEITTDALLRAPDSSITATSTAGPELDGTVDIQAPDETIRADTEVTPQVVGVPEVGAACVGGSGDNSEFVVTGRGGLPRSPSSIQQSNSGWRSPSSPSSAAGLNRVPQIVEAQGWVDNGDGTVNFTAQPANPAYASARNTACVSGAAQNPS